MQKTYTRINWKNYPNTETPLNESNLNKMDSAVNEIDNRVISMDTSKLDVVTGNKLLKDVSVNNTTGVITLTALDGTTKTLNTNLGKIAVNFTYDSVNQRLVLTDSDGTVIYISLAELVQNNDFADSDTIAFSVNNGIVSAIVRNGSITEEHLRPNYLADIRVSEANARASMEQAEEYKDESALIKTDVVNTHGEVELIKQQCENISINMINDAETIETRMLAEADEKIADCEYVKSECDSDLNEIKKIVGLSSFTVDMDTGHLMYDNDAYYTFTIDPATGHMEWEVA